MNNWEKIKKLAEELHIEIKKKDKGDPEDVIVLNRPTFKSYHFRFKLGLNQDIEIIKLLKETKRTKQLWVRRKDGFSVYVLPGPIKDLKTCKECAGYCCNVSPRGDFGVEPLFDTRKARRSQNYREKLRKNGINPNKCNYLSNTGCIIPRSKRPKICVEYMCNKIEDSLNRKKLDLPKYYVYIVGSEDYGYVRPLGTGSLISGRL